MRKDRKKNTDAHADIPFPDPVSSCAKDRVALRSERAKRTWR